MPQKQVDAPDASDSGSMASQVVVEIRDCLLCQAGECRVSNVREEVAANQIAVSALGVLFHLCRLAVNHWPHHCTTVMLSSCIPPPPFDERTISQKAGNSYRKGWNICRGSNYSE